MEQQLPGHLVLILAPSGSGKRTLVEYVTAKFPDIYFAKTLTSRVPRQGAIENPTYQFVSREAFETLIHEHAFVEWAEYSGNYYGTPLHEFADNLAAGKLVVKEMELQGVEQIRKHFAPENVTVIYIDAGPWEDLQERIVNRAPISPEELELRRQHYEKEKKSMPEADIIINNSNGRLKEAREEFAAAFAEIRENIHSK